MTFDWPYYSLVNGWLVDKDDLLCPFQSTPFSLSTTAADAEVWLVDNDIRGTVQKEMVSA